MKKIKTDKHTLFSAIIIADYCRHCFRRMLQVSPTLVVLALTELDILTSSHPHLCSITEPAQALHVMPF